VFASKLRIYFSATADFATATAVLKFDDLLAYLKRYSSSDDRLMM
jgi:hypothetical protein